MFQFMKVATKLVAQQMILLMKKIKFLRGCHQLSHVKLFKEINKKNYLELSNFKVHYANFTEYSEKNPSYDWKFAIPTFNNILFEKNLN